MGGRLDVGRGCPAPDSAAVRAVLGRVGYALASLDQHGVPHCQFRRPGDREGLLTMSVAYYTQDKFDQEYAGGELPDLGNSFPSTVLDPPPGVFKEVTDYTYSATVRASYPRQRLVAAVDADGAGTPENVQRAAAAWFRTAEPAIRRYRPLPDGRQPQDGF
ncbi:hypothetical protein BH11ACT8_BH11ACT8_24080 [soil metagenome]